LHSSPLHNHSLGLDQLNIWLDDCNTKHGKCTGVASEKVKLPTRLLDMNALPAREMLKRIMDPYTLLDSSFVKLIEPDANETGHYIFLSYCWGKYLAYKTTKANM